VKYLASAWTWLAAGLGAVVAFFLLRRGKTPTVLPPSPSPERLEAEEEFHRQTEAADARADALRAKAEAVKAEEWGRVSREIAVAKNVLLEDEDSLTEHLRKVGDDMRKPLHGIRALMYEGAPNPGAFVV
jgi:hypothetical protein